MYDSVKDPPKPALLPNRESVDKMVGSDLLQFSFRDVHRRSRHDANATKEVFGAFHRCEPDKNVVMDLLTTCNEYGLADESWTLTTSSVCICIRIQIVYFVFQEAVSEQQEHIFSMND